MGVYSLVVPPYIQHCWFYWNNVKYTEINRHAAHCVIDGWLLADFCSILACLFHDSAIFWCTDIDIHSPRDWLDLVIGTQHDNGATLSHLKTRDKRCLGAIDSHSINLATRSISLCLCSHTYMQVGVLSYAVVNDNPCIKPICFNHSICYGHLHLSKTWNIQFI